MLPKVLLSRATGVLTRLPVPRALRGAYYGWFARRYGADLGEMAGSCTDFPSLAAFFQRPLRDGARPVDAGAALVWPCDGRVVATGSVARGRLPQVKGVFDYDVAELLGEPGPGATLARDGTAHATVYLAPGDYHRVHAPFTAEVTRVRRIRGTLFPVNPAAVRCIDGLFVRNARTVFDCRLDDGRAAAVVMVGALNVGDVHVSVTPPQRVRIGDEIGRFGFGSTTVVLVETRDGEPALAACEPGSTVRIGAAMPLRVVELRR